MQVAGDSKRAADCSNLPSNCLCPGSRPPRSLKSSVLHLRHQAHPRQDAFGPGMAAPALVRRVRVLRCQAEHAFAEDRDPPPSLTLLQRVFFLQFQLLNLSPDFIFKTLTNLAGGRVCREACEQGSTETPNLTRRQPYIQCKKVPMNKQISIIFYLFKYFQASVLAFGCLRA